TSVPRQSAAVQSRNGSALHPRLREPLPLLHGPHRVGWYLRIHSAGTRIFPTRSPLSFSLPPSLSLSLSLSPHRLPLTLIAFAQSFGVDIDAACGQLYATYDKKQKKERPRAGAASSSPSISSATHAPQTT